MNRRGFLATCLALAAAPAIVRADSLMRIVPRETTIFTGAPVFPAEWGEIEGFRIHTSTDFGIVSEEAKRLWSRSVWRAAREQPHIVMMIHPSHEAEVRALIQQARA